MAEFQKSLWRVVLDPGGGSQTILIDWGDRVGPIVFPWEQAVQTSRPVRAAGRSVFARGTAVRELTIEKRLDFDSHEELHEGQLDATLGLPAGDTLACHLRVYDLGGQNGFPASSPAVGGGTEGTYTHAHYISAAAVLRRVEAMPNRTGMNCVVRYTLDLEEPVKQ